MTRFLERLLNLQRGDLQRGLLLFFYLLMIMTSYQLGKIARAALFLDQYKASKLPYADIVIAVSVGFVVAGYVLISRHTNLRNLLIGTIVAYAGVFGAFWYLAHYYPHTGKWLAPLFYLWVGIFGVLSTAQVWTLANFVLTTREAKRIFALVGSGAIIGATFGGLLASLLAKRYGVESLMLCMIASIAVCGSLVFLIWQQKTTRAHGETEAPGQAEASPNLREMVRVVLSSKYLLTIAGIIFISSVVTKSLEWQFTAISSLYYPQKDAIAVFFGRFYMVTGLTCLATQLVLTSRLLRRFGIGPALFILPVALMTGEMLVALLGTLVAAVLLRGGDQVLRYSIDKSSTELLYLPVATDLKLPAKSFIDTFIWRAGDGVSGLTLAFLADRLGWSPVRIAWVVAAYLLVWLAIALGARRQYVVTLRESILQHRLDAERASAPVLDRAAAEILTANFSPTTEPKEILYALDLFGMERQRSAHPAVRDLLAHPAAEVRQRALSILAQAHDRSILPQVEKMLGDPALEVRTEALLYLTHHAHVDPLDRIQELGDFADFSIRSAMVAFLARPGETQNLEAARVLLEGMVREPAEAGVRTRLEAARLMASLPDEFDEELRMLVMDAEHDVAREAIRAVGRLHKRRFLLRVLDRLADPELVNEVVEAVGGMGERVVGTLRDHMNDSEVPLAVRREIPAILVRVGSPSAARALEEMLLEADTVLRFRAISGLNKLRRASPDIPVDEQMIETVLAAEMMGHYRSYQILGTLGGDLEADDPVVRALRETIEQEVERVFRLLGLLYPKYDLYSAYFGLQSRDAVVHANALEFLDNVLKPQLRNVLVPLLDSDVSVAQRVSLADRFIGAQVQTQEEAVAALVQSDDPWLKSCGAYAIGSLGLRNLAHELESCLTHPDPLLRETARQAKVRLAGSGASA